VDVKAPGLQWYADKLNAGERFSFARYGNGEWDLVLGQGTRTGSGSQKFSPDLREAMRNTLMTRRMGNYHLAIQSTGYLKRLGLLTPAQRWLEDNAPATEWYNGEVFHKASRRGRLRLLVKALEERFTVVVGPPWLRRLPFADAFILVQSKNCWQDVGAIAAQVRMHQDCVVSFSAGPAAKVLIHRLYPEMGEHSWLIDFGSVWDPYCGKKSRRYHGRMTKKIIEKNLGRRR